MVGTASGCDDGDPCTVDTCTATGCLHDPASGFTSIVCALPDASLRIAACTGEQIPGAVIQRSDQGRSLISRAASGPVKQQRRFILKAAKALRSAAQQVTIAAKHGGLSPACVAALRSPLHDAAARAARLAATL